MGAPINTYNSTTDLSIGHIPQGADDNPDLHSELLDIHNALEILLTASDDADAIFAAYIAKRRSVDTKTADYDITDEDNTILLDGSANSVTAFLPKASDLPGYRYSIKCIDDTFPCFADTKEVAETLEEDTEPFELFKGEYIDVKSDGFNWIVTG